MVKRQWRFYETAGGSRPVRAFLDDLRDVDAAAVAAAMKEVKDFGTRYARHLRGDIYEVRADGDRVIYRVLFSEEGAKGRVLLALEAFGKKSRKTPKQVLDTAERRLRDWRKRGQE